MSMNAAARWTKDKSFLATQRDKFEALELADALLDPRTSFVERFMHACNNPFTRLKYK